MSYEAIALVRRTGRSDEWAEKWATVATKDIRSATDLFRKMGYDVRGISIIDQDQATDTARKIAGSAS